MTTEATLRQLGTLRTWQDDRRRWHVRMSVEFGAAPLRATIYLPPNTSLMEQLERARKWAKGRLKLGPNTNVKQPLNSLGLRWVDDDSGGYVQ